MRWVLCSLSVLMLSSCCRFAKRDCFPPCDPPKVVQVAKPCELPPALVLPKVSYVETGPVTCPSSWVCYDTVNAALLAMTLSKLRVWVLEAQAACGGAK